MIQTIIRFLLAAIGIYVLFVGVIVGFQKKLLFIPASGAYDSPDSVGVEGEDVWFKTDDDVKLHGWYLPNNNTDYVILFSHGNAGNIGMRTELASMILKSGASVFMYDYRGYGLSEGSPGEEGLYTDVRAAVRYLIEEKNIPENKIILYGRSLGGAVAAYAATEYNAAGLVLDSAFTNIRSVVKDLYPFIPPVLARVNFETDQYVESRKQMPLLIFHSPEDRLIDFRQGRELFENATDPKQFVELQGGHNDNFRQTEEIFTNSWIEFVDRLPEQNVDTEMKVKNAL